MKIIIHTRHADLASDFKVIAEEKLRSMERFSVAKIAVLVFIIIFIQKRPQGIFALKGRQA